MPEKPLLIFPAPSQVGRFVRKGGGPQPLFSPNKQTQVARLQPKLDILEQALQARRIEVQADVNGVEPEMVLVLETRGHVNEFFKAVRNVPGLEWLAEEEQEFAGDEFFHYDNIDKEIRGKVYFILTNYQALVRLLALWNNYKYSNGFQRGTTKWRDVFALLHDIRQWSVEDRITETGILKDWSYRLQYEQNIIPFEIELWFRKTAELRAEAEARVENLLEQFEGEIISRSSILEIAYHAILVKAPIQIFNNLTEQTDIGFFKASDIMFLRPVGQCAVKKVQSDEENTDVVPPVQQLTPPVVAVFDGLPLQNHRKLANRLIIDDPQNFSQGYLAADRSHGTGIASIIIYGDLAQNNEAIRSALYMRPILKPENTFRGNVEYIPEEILIVDLIHSAVKRLFDGDGQDGAIAPSVKIINLSIGDPYRILDTSLSAWAKLLDWLSFKYNVLFIVSAGNCSDDFDFSNYPGGLDALLNNVHDLKQETLKFIYHNTRHRKIISPAESINAVTVGASDFDDSDFQIPNERYILFASHKQICPLSRIGLGYRRSVKPEVLLPGGRAMFRQSANSVLRYINIHGQPGVKTAAPSATGSLTGTVFTNGTSNSAALYSHLCAKLHENFVESQFPPSLIGELFPLAAKTLLVHTGSWDEASILQIQSAINLQQGNQKDLITRFLGYGNISAERVFQCTEKRVTLIGSGALEAEQAHLFKLPLPVGISGSTHWRSLTVTLGWFTPINPTNQIYRKAKLWFDFPNKSHEQLLSVSRKFYDNDTVCRGTIQHEIFDGQLASAFLDGTELEIRVNCKEDAPGLDDQQIKYLLSVTLEIDQAFQINLYNEIDIKIKAKIPVT